MQQESRAGEPSSSIAGERPLEILAVIPARGGSKGIPRKNLQKVAGKTLVARAVESALDAHLVTRVIGSTDDREIADEVLASGGEILSLRRIALAQDDTPDTPVFSALLDELSDEGYAPDIVVNVRPTAPLRTAADIDAAIEVLRRNPDARSVKSVSLVTEHPYKMWHVGASGMLEPLLPDWHLVNDGDPDPPRQTLPAVYRSNGAVDAVWVSALQATGRFHPGPLAPFIMEPSRSLDIDTERDLDLATELAAAAPNRIDR